MKSIYIYIGFILFFNINSLKAQKDSLQIQVGIGVSALNIWQEGLRLYEFRLERNLSDDISGSRNLFINNLTIDVKIGTECSYGRLTYLVSSAWMRRMDLRILMLTYGVQKSVWHDKIELGLEGGLAYGQNLISTPTFNRRHMIGTLGFSISIPIWKGLCLDNRFSGLLILDELDPYLNHTIALSYKF